MRIALYVHCFFPAHFYGTEAYALTLAKELIALGEEPVVITATLAGEPAQKRLIEERVYDGVRVISIDKNLFPNRSVRDTYEQPSLRNLHERLLRKIQPNVVHVCHLISHTTALLDVARAMGIPVFATLTDFFGFCYNNRLENAQGELCAGPDEARANCIACFLQLVGARPDAKPLTRLGADRRLRPFVAKGLARLGRREENPFSISGFEPNDIVVRPDILRRAMGVYCEAIAPTLFLKRAYEANAFPAPMHISHFGVEIDRSPKPARARGDSVRLGFIGQLFPHKGAHLLLDSLRASGRQNLSLQIWGPDDQDPAYYATLRQKAEGLPVRFQGTLPRQELAGALAGLDYLVIPSTWYENSPLVLLQALATHTPVIISDVLGMTEFVQDGRNGFHFSRGDVASLTAVLHKVADDPELAARLSAATSYDRAPADMAKDVLAMYRAHALGGVDAAEATAAPIETEGADQSGSNPAQLGVEGPLDSWLAYNEGALHIDSAEASHIAPFPPLALMTATSGLSRTEDFTRHGVDIMRALAAASPAPLASYRAWLDFGVGAGRVARLFKGYRGVYVGVDVDPHMVEWVRGNLPWVKALQTAPRQPLPFADQRFDAVVSISVFTHMNDEDHRFYLNELWRVTRPGAILMLTVHGDRAIQRASAESNILDLLCIPADALQGAGKALAEGDGFHFTRQSGHLTSSLYDYGVTFVNRRWIDAVWTKWFDIETIVPGAIHDFQDIVVARRR
ncbi:glycosyltransferase [Methylocella tundrae]|uniref:Glycosyl transferase group 1 n=1 Tax=Methylocella tundrae TaxID=227605 RepID=A0A4U8YXD5_METTU|nr:glycosyltransferase [Methylocella tundrae]WPP05653.1 glycosyltransferase [Methylocella tundrae]VFU08121.1 Glycosyl transferase group 1 [Methylocella tundrae]